MLTSVNQLQHTISISISCHHSGWSDGKTTGGVICQFISWIPLAGRYQIDSSIYCLMDGGQCGSGVGHRTKTIKIDLQCLYRSFLSWPGHSAKEFANFSVLTEKSWSCRKDSRTVLTLITLTLPLPAGQLTGQTDYLTRMTRVFQGISSLLQNWPLAC